MIRWWFMVLLLVTGNAFCYITLTKVIDLNYVQSDQIIQLIKPLLRTGEQISGSGQTLVVKVSPQTLTELRAIIHKIDVPPQTISISIVQGSPDWLNSQNRKDVTYSTHSQSEELRNQSVSVMNGGAAFVSTGDEVPIVTAVGWGVYPGVVYQQKLTHTGLWVKPLLQGSQVKLVLRRVREQQNPANEQQFDNQHLDTTLMIPLNTWVSLGSSEGAKPTDTSSRIYSAGRSFTQNSTLYIKVSVVHVMPLTK